MDTERLKEYSTKTTSTVFQHLKKVHVQSAVGFVIAYKITLRELSTIYSVIYLVPNKKKCVWYICWCKDRQENILIYHIYININIICIILIY